MMNRVRSGQPPQPRSLHGGRRYSTAVSHGPFRHGAAPTSLASWNLANWNPPPLGLGSSLTVADVREAGVPMLGEQFTPSSYQPQLATKHRTIDVFSSSSSSGNFAEETVYLVHDDLSKAYRRIKVAAEINRAGAKWGSVTICLVLDKNPRRDGEFCEPAPGSSRLVAIKELDMGVVKNCKCKEDPDIELAAAEFVGDGIHVLRHDHVLTDGKCRYVVMPFCSGGDVCDAIPWKFNLGDWPAGYEEDVGRKRFRQMLECLAHLQRNGVCHGDLSPENIMIHNGRCIFIDFGMSFRVAPSPDGREGGRVLSPWRGTFGKPPYMAPELWAEAGERRSFDGCSIDIYSLGATLYAMLTGLKLQRSPSPTEDRLNRLFVLGNGLFDEDYVRRSTPENIPEIQIRIEAHRELSNEAKDLIRGMTKPNPEERMTLAQVVQHDWVVGPPPAREGVGASGLPSAPGMSERITNIRNDPPTMRSVASSRLSGARVHKASQPKKGARRLSSPEKPTPTSMLARKIPIAREGYINPSRSNLAAVVSDDENPAVVPRTQRKSWAPVAQPLPLYYPTSGLFKIGAGTSLFERLSECQKLLGMRATFNDDAATVVIETADDVKMRLSVFQDPDQSASENVVVDLQRLSGCSVTFQTHRRQIFSAIN